MTNLSKADSDLSLAGRKKAGPEAPPLTAPLTEAEKRGLLEGYALVPRALWAEVPGRRHVRYVGADGGFRRGGFVGKNPIVGAKKAGTFIQIHGGRAGTASSAQWVVNYDAIAELWVKFDIDTRIAYLETRAAVEGLNGNIERLAAYARELETRLRALENRSIP